MAYKDEKKLDNRYNATSIEDRCIEFWKESKVYKYKGGKSRDDTFVIDTPPPTVSGYLHIGHIFSYTQTDVVARFQRMMGKDVFYPIGWDDNGLPTERRVQNYYNVTCNPTLPYDPDFEPEHDPKYKGPPKEVSRKNFIEACELLTTEDEKVFEDVFKQIGHSYDWDLQYTTIGEHAIKTSQESFIDLLEKGNIQSVEAPTMWDVTFQSAIAQAEIEDREVDGDFHDLKFTVDGSDEDFIISTTRPELLPACIAIVAHPDDERYQGLFGKNAIVPLFKAPVPIIASEHAERDKGTGIMMVATFGDAADVAWWKQSYLPIKQIVGLDGRIMDIEYGEGAFETLDKNKAQNNYSKLKGLTIKQARTKIIDMLQKDGILQGEPKKIKHTVKFYEKGNLPLEFVSSRQWFVKLLEEKQRLAEAGKEIKWKPSHMQHRFVEWAEGLNQDWCISRQRFFGIPFPLWYKLDDNGQPDYNNPIVADRKQLPVDPMSEAPHGYDEKLRNKKGGFMGEPDVMDTWATSALTPQIAMGLAPEGANISLPFDVRPQAHDIIRTWAFYTVAKSLLHSNQVPWKGALISGFILDPDRKKMSKSKGNVVTPMHLIEEYSADGVRYWASKARLGVDTAFDEKMMGQGRKLTLKMFNASKFVFSMVENSRLAQEDDYKRHITNPVDRSWMSKLANTTEFATRALKSNDYATALEAVESRFWDFCDNYLEIIKKRAYSDDNKSASASLMQTMDSFSKMFAPFCPFITEEIYQSRPWSKNNESLHTQSWAKFSDFDGIRENDSTLYDTLVKVTSDIRGAKTTKNKSQKTPVASIDIRAPEDVLLLLEKGQADLENVGNINQGKINYHIDEEFSVDNIELDLAEDSKPQTNKDNDIVLSGMLNKLKNQR